MPFDDDPGTDDLIAEAIGYHYAQEEDRLLSYLYDELDNFGDCFSGKSTQAEASLGGPSKAYRFDPAAELQGPMSAELRSNSGMRDSA